MGEMVGNDGCQHEYKSGISKSLEEIKQDLAKFDKLLQNKKRSLEKGLLVERINVFGIKECVLSKR